MAREEPVTFFEEIVDLVKSVDSADDCCSGDAVVLSVSIEKKEFNNYFHQLPKELCFLIAKYVNSSYMSLLRLSCLSKQWYEVVYCLPFSSLYLWQSTDLTIKAKENYYQIINITSKGRETENISLFSSFSSPFPSLLSCSTACSSMFSFSPSPQEEQYTFHRCFELKIIKPLEMTKLKYGRNEEEREEENENENESADFDYDSDNGESEEGEESNESGEKRPSVIHHTKLSSNQQKALISSLKREMIRKHQQFHYLWKISIFFHKHLCQFEQFFTNGTNYLAFHFFSLKKQMTFASKNVFYCVSAVCFLSLLLLSFSSSTASLWLCKFFALAFFLCYGYYYLYLSFYELTSLIKNHLWFGSFSYCLYHFQWICIITKYFLPLFYNGLYLLASSMVLSVLNSLGTSDGGWIPLLTKPAWNEICSSIAVYYHNFSFFHMLIIFIINTPPSLLFIFGGGGGAGNGGNGGANVVNQNGGNGGLGIGGMLLAGIFGNNNNNNQNNVANNQQGIGQQNQNQQPQQLFPLQQQPQQFPPQFQDLNIFNNNNDNNGFFPQQQQQQQQQPLPFFPPIAFGGGQGVAAAVGAGVPAVGGGGGGGGGGTHSNPNYTLSKTIQLLTPFILQKVLNAFLIYPLTVYVNHRYDEIPSSLTAAASVGGGSSSSLEWLFYVLLLRFLLPIIHWFKILLILQMITVFYSFYTKYSITPYQLLEDGEDDEEGDIGYSGEGVTMIGGGGNGGGGGRRKFWKTLGKELYWWIRYLWFPFPKPSIASVSAASTVGTTPAISSSMETKVDMMDGSIADSASALNTGMPPFSADLPMQDSSADEETAEETQRRSQQKNESETRDKNERKQEATPSSSCSLLLLTDSQSQYYHQWYSLFLQFGLLFFIFIQKTIRTEVTVALNSNTSNMSSSSNSTTSSSSSKGGFNVERIVFIYLLLEILSIKTLQRLQKKITSNDYYLQKAKVSKLSSSSIDWINILMMGGFGGGAGGGVGGGAAVAQA
jgi:hypothetical protein